MCLGLGADADSRLEAYRGSFRPHGESEELTEIRLGGQQNQPVGSRRFLDTIEGMPGQRREPKSRGRPRKSRAGEGAISASGADSRLIDPAWPLNLAGLMGTAWPNAGITRISFPRFTLKSSIVSWLTCIRA